MGPIIKFWVGQAIGVVRFRIEFGADPYVI